MSWQFKQIEIGGQGTKAKPNVALLENKLPRLEMLDVGHRKHLVQFDWF